MNYSPAPALAVATEQSMAIPQFHEPQPDITLTSEPSDSGAIPAGSVKLILEVSDSIIRFDLRQKAVMYVVAEIPEYWVADVNKRTLRQMWRPDRGLYSERRDIPFGELVMAETIAGLSIATDGI